MDQQPMLDPELSCKAAALMGKIDTAFAPYKGMLRKGRLMPAVQALARGERLDCSTLPPLLGPMRRFTPRDVLTMMHVQAVYQMWRTAPIVHAMHPDVVDVVVDSVDDKFPGELFRHLPYPYPMIVFPQPRVFGTPTGLQGALVGLFFYGIAGRADDERFCGTHDPAMTRLGIMPVSFVTDPRGTKSSWDFTRFSVELTKNLTVESAVQDNLRDFTADADPDTDLRRVEAWVRLILPVALNTLLYVADQSAGTDHVELNADTDGKPGDAKKPKGKNRKATKPPAWAARMMASGWRIGPPMRRAWTKLAAQSATGTGRKQGPQWRRAHRQIYWTGAGRLIPKLRWKFPYLTRKDEADSLANVVIPVGVPRESTGTPDGQSA